MAYSEYWGNMVYHRLDHITNMTITDKKAYPLRELKGYENGIDYNKIATQMPYMYADDPVKIDFVADLEIIDQVVDWFGSEATIKTLEEASKVMVSVKSSPAAMKHWALQYIEHVSVVSPVELKKDIEKSLKNYLRR